MSASRRFLIAAVAIGYLLLGGACLAWGVYVLWAGGAAVATLIDAKQQTDPLLGAQAKQATEAAATGLGAVIVAAAGVVGGCAVAEGLPVVLVGVGLLPRRNWARVLALVLAVLVGLEGAALLLGPPSGPALIVGGLLLALAVLSFVALLGRGATLAFAGQPVERPAPAPAETATARGPLATGWLAVAVLAVALLLSIATTVVLALRPVSFTVLTQPGAGSGPDAKVTYEISPVHWVTAGVWPDTSAAYRDRVRKLNDAADKGHLSRVVEMLQMGASANDKDERGQTPLMIAADRGHASLVLLLMMAGGDVNEKDDQGETALLRAVAGNADRIALLVAQQAGKAGPDYALYRDGAGRSALDLAAAKGSPATFEAVLTALAGAFERGRGNWYSPLIEKGPGGKTPLEEIRARGDKALDAALEKYLRQQLDVRNAAGQSGLEEASAHGRTATVQALLQRGASLQAPDPVKTALMLAAEHGHILVVAALLDSFKDPNQRRDYINRAKREYDIPTAVSLARAKGHHEIVALLLQTASAK
jgi:ankyrin repeat protein